MVRIIQKRGNSQIFCNTIYFLVKSSLSPTVYDSYILVIQGTINWKDLGWPSIIIKGQSLSRIPESKKHLIDLYFKLFLEEVTSTNFFVPVGCPSSTKTWITQFTFSKDACQQQKYIDQRKEISTIKKMSQQGWQWIFQ